MSVPARPRHPNPTRDLPPRPGVTLRPGGADIAIYAGHADGVDLCLFEPGDDSGESERRRTARTGMSSSGPSASAS